MLVIAADAAQPGDHHLISRLEQAQQLIQPGTGGQFAGDLLDHDAARLDPGRFQLVLLGVGVLLAGGDPRVPVPGHLGAPVPRAPAIMGLLTPLSTVYRTLN